MVSSGMPSNGFGNELSPEDDWPAQVAGSIERVVGTVRDRTTGPLQTLARGMVYGTFAVIIGVTAVVLVVITSVRLLDNYLPSSVFGENHTWAAHMFVGLAFTIAGALLWRRRQ